MATYTKFEELPIWQEARMLYREIIAFTKRPALSKEFRYCGQIKAAAGSIMDNIAEGFERDSNLEFINHLSYSKGSCGEVRSQLHRGLDEGFLDEKELSELNSRFEALGSQIASLIRYLNQTEIRGQKFLGRNQKSQIQNQK